MKERQCVNCRFFRPLFKGSTLENPAFGGTCAHENGPIGRVLPDQSCMRYDACHNSGIYKGTRNEKVNK